MVPGWDTRKKQEGYAWKFGRIWPWNGQGSWKRAVDFPGALA